MEEKPLETGQGWENGRREPRWRRLWLLFSGMFYISAFTFGGGFVIVTFMKRKFVDTLHWLDEQEMLDFTALAQSSPGAIAVNAAILVGLKICGAAGMAAAVLGIKNYFQRKDKNLRKLARYAKKMGIQDKIRDIVYMHMEP